MSEVFDKVIKTIKRIVMLFVILVALLIYSPLLFTDKHTHEAVKAIQNSYAELYTGGSGLGYAVIMQAAKDTAYDTIESYQDNSIIRSKRYEIEMKALNVWNDVDYEGKDKLLRKLSEAMKAYSYAPAKAAVDINKMTTGKAFNTLVTYKALCYNVRFTDSMFYVIFLLLSTLAVIGTYYLLYIVDFRDEYDEYEEDEDSYSQDNIDEDKEHKEYNSKEEFEQSFRSRRISNK